MTVTVAVKNQPIRLERSRPSPRKWLEPASNPCRIEAQEPTSAAVRWRLQRLEQLLEVTRAATRNDTDSGA